jgi:hypothetical protein
MPQIDYGRFLFRAVVDWIELEVRTSVPTNAQTIRRHGAFKYVKPIDLGNGSAATIFRIKLHDPKDFDQVAAIVASLADRFKLTAAPCITAIEVSLDAYSKAQCRSDLAVLVTRMYQYQSHPVSMNRRFSGRWRHDVMAIPGRVGIERLLEAGRVIAIGNREDQLSQRLYVKSTNAGAGLPTEQHRARTEITMQGNGVPHMHLPAWESFQFESLSKYFRYRKLKQDTEPALILALEDAGFIVGARRLRPRKEGGTRLYGRATNADTLLNARSRDALRELTRRWTSGGTPPISDKQTTSHQSPVMRKYGRGKSCKSLIRL